MSYSLVILVTLTFATATMRVLHTALVLRHYRWLLENHPDKVQDFFAATGNHSVFRSLTIPVSRVGGQQLTVTTSAALTTGDATEGPDAA